MGFAEFMGKKFLGQKVFISICDGESEVIILDQHWFTNREFFQGILEEIDDGVIVLNIEGEGRLYINSAQISYMWTEEKLNPSKIMRTSLNKKPYAIGKNIK